MKRTECIVGQAFGGEVLASDHASALTEAMRDLIDQLCDDIGLLLETPERIEETSMSRYLHRCYRRRYGPLFARQFLMSAAAVAWKLAQPQWHPLACVAEELALNAMVRKAETLLEERGKPGLNAGVAAALRKLSGVRAVAMVASGLVWLHSSRGVGGRVVDRSPPGYAIPIEAEAVAPHSYARFVPKAERRDVRSLRPAQTLMARTEAKLRGAGAGLRLDLAAGPVRAWLNRLPTSDCRCTTAYTRGARTSSREPSKRSARAPR